MNRVLCETVCRLCPVISSDIVDEDTYIQGRSVSLSSVVIGSMTGLGKVSQSIAPMLGYTLLGSHLVAIKNGLPAAGLPNGGLLGSTGGSEVDSKRDTVNLILRSITAVPLIIVICQLMLWSKYTLRGDYLKTVKDFVSNLKNPQKDIHV